MRVWRPLPILSDYPKADCEGLESSVRGGEGFREGVGMEVGEGEGEGVGW